MYPLHLMITAADHSVNQKRYDYDNISKQAETDAQYNIASRSLNMEQFNILQSPQRMHKNNPPRSYRHSTQLAGKVQFVKYHSIMGTANHHKVSV